MGDATVNHIGGLYDGDEESLAWLCENFLPSVEAYSRRKIGKFRKVADEEDIAAQAIYIFWQGIREGRFTDVETRDDLRKILCGIAFRTAQGHVRQQMAQKRGGAGLRGESMFAQQRDAGGPGLDGFEGGAPQASGESMNAVLAQCEDLLKSLDDLDRKIAVLKFEGHTHAEIAEMLDYSTGHIERRVSKIKQVWMERETYFRSRGE